MSAGRPAPSGPMRGAGLQVDLTVDLGPHGLTVQAEVPAGGSVAVLGPNGAGKSLLLRTIAGQHRPTAGHVTWAGAALSTPEAVTPPHRRAITLLDQQPHLFAHLDVLDNVAFGPRAQGLSRSRARERADHWLHRIDLTWAAHRRPRQLSGGQQQRVALARALAAEPDVLLLDEPFSALDAEALPAVRDLVFDQLAATGTTAVLVTHDVADARRCDDALVLEAGRVTQRGHATSLAVDPQTAFVAALSGWCVVDAGLLDRTEAGRQAVVHPEDVLLLPPGAQAVAAGGHGGPVLEGAITSVGVAAGRWQVRHASGLVASLPLSSEPPAVGETRAVAVTRHRTLPGGSGPEVTAPA